MFGAIWVLAYYGLERFEEAERCFRFSLSMDTTHAQSHINLGNTLINVFRPDEAVVLLERGLELDPSSHNSLVEPGIGLSLAWSL